MSLSRSARYDILNPLEITNQIYIIKLQIGCLNKYGFLVASSYLLIIVNVGGVNIILISIKNVVINKSVKIRK